MDDVDRRRRWSNASRRFAQNKTLFALDFILYIAVITPCFVAFWAATCDIAYQLDDFGVNVLRIVCIVLYVGFHLGQTLLYNIARKYLKTGFCFYFWSRIYIYLFATSGLLLMVVVWEYALESDPSLNSPIFNNCTLAGSIIVLAIFKLLPNIGGADAIGLEKTAEDIFLFPTFSRVQWKKNKLLYLADSVFSVLIVGTLVILVWRGAWCLLDTYLYPEEKYISSLISLVAGYTIVFVTFALQPTMKILIRKFHGWKRLAIIDIYVLFSFCGTINVWRGIWNLIETHADLGSSLRNCFLVHILCFLILVVLNSSNTLLVRGVYIDAEENGEDCIEFPCYYFRLLYQERERKKMLKDLNSRKQVETLLDKNDDSRMNVKSTENETRDDEDGMKNELINDAQKIQIVVTPDR